VTVATRTSPSARCSRPARQDEGLFGVDREVRRQGDDDDEVIVAIALDKLHEMSLARSYSLAEIRALTDVTAHVAGESAED